MRKLRLAVLLCLLLALTVSAAQAREITIEDFMNANTVEKLLAKHSSIALLQHADSRQAATWVNQDYRYCAVRTDEIAREGDMEFLQTDRYYLMLYYYMFRDGVYPVPTIMLDAGLGDSIFYNPATGESVDLLYEPESTALEQVTGTEEKNGVLTMTTVLKADAFRSAWAGDYPEGSYCELVYQLNAETLELIGDTETVMNTDGKALKDILYYQLFGKNIQTEQQVLYDIPMPDDVTLMVRALGAYLDASGEDARTVTFILDPGTDQERSFTSAGAKGYAVALNTGEYDYELYLDAAMTVEAPNDDLSSDRTLYVRLIPPTEENK